jgi:hypothetical protein
MIAIKRHHRRNIASLLAGCLVFAAACKKSAGSPAAVHGEAAERGREMTSQEVKKCGFMPYFNNGAFAGYRPALTTSATPPIYTFPRAATINELKVSLMLARACNDVTVNRAERVEPLCNDSLGLVNAHAKDAAFLGTVGALVDGKPDQCVQFLTAHMVAPMDFNKLAALLAPTVKRNVALNAEYRAFWKKRSGGIQAQ